MIADAFLFGNSDQTNRNQMALENYFKNSAAICSSKKIRFHLDFNQIENNVENRFLDHGCTLVLGCIYFVHFISLPNICRTNLKNKLSNEKLKILANRRY